MDVRVTGVSTLLLLLLSLLPLLLLRPPSSPGAEAEEKGPLALSQEEAQACGCCLRRATSCAHLVVGDHTGLS